MAKVMAVLELLSDGKWHRMEELLLGAKLDDKKFQEITAFLSMYDFVKVDEKNRRVKINRDFRKLLAEPATH